MMKISRKNIGILFIFLFVILIESFSFATYQNAVLTEEKLTNNKIEVENAVSQEVADVTEEEQEVLDLINAYRIENGLTELKVYSKLQAVAELKAEDLVDNNYFSHNSEKLGTPFEMLENNGVMYVEAGENLAGNVTADRAVDAWINSKSHRENILNEDFEYTGICVVDSPVYGKVFVQLFIGI